MVLLLLGSWGLYVMGIWGFDASMTPDSNFIWPCPPDDTSDSGLLDMLHMDDLSSNCILYDPGCVPGPRW